MRVAAGLAPKVRNRDALTSVGDQAGRDLVLAIAESTLQNLDAYRRITAISSYENGVLRIGHRTWDVTQKRNIYLVGAGKACNAMAMAIDHMLGDRLTAGVAIVKLVEDTDHYGCTEVFVGGHPLPNAEGNRGSRRIVELVDSAGPDDLFIAVISGGSSALMNLPVDGITIQDEADATDLLLKSGAGIFEVNAVRRHISQLNGGRLAQRIQDRGAELIGVGISDAVGRRATRDISQPVNDYASTPIGPDATTLNDARAVLARYDLREVMPTSVVSYLDNAGPDKETPKSFDANTYYLVNTLPDSVALAQDAAGDLGVRAHVLTTFLEGESKDAGTFMASLARQIQTVGGPFEPPCILLSAGETTTHIAPDATVTGHGGPSQELVVGFAIAAATIPGAVMFSIDSEGTDGTSLAAGGLTDSTTARRASTEGIDLHSALRGHGTYEALAAVGDAVITGNTGTNLCDLNILYVPKVRS